MRPGPAFLGLHQGFAVNSTGRLSPRGLALERPDRGRYLDLRSEGKTGQPPRVVCKLIAGSAELSGRRQRPGDVGQYGRVFVFQRASVCERVWSRSISRIFQWTAAENGFDQPYRKRRRGLGMQAQVSRIIKVRWNLQLRPICVGWMIEFSLTPGPGSAPEWPRIPPRVMARVLICALRLFCGGDRLWERARVVRGGAGVSHDRIEVNRGT